MLKIYLPVAVSSATRWRLFPLNFCSDPGHIINFWLPSRTKVLV